ncbi:glycoside hydrolase family 32 protein [Lacticaseibacillus yichunensis]|uniref:beta-fructofuranosidase n=1 Tax=Lacticaseibacillus yichunensis TaxID=2486015 RepID=A0ABW4CRK6_9LACO|nr:glycoside hydrolase family 32 protein [Lacticaseibacillus yichunensis]
MTLTLAQADAYIRDHAATVAPQFRPQAHFAAPIGWLNDPNGLVYFAGRFHLFYQYNPYSAVWDTMHWGHATSRNLIDWHDEPVALAPDQDYDRNGVFSGSAIVAGNTLVLMYTGNVQQADGTVRQNQNIATSTDGIHFTKYASNPVLTEADLPAGASVQNFRDPKLTMHDGHYYVVLASSDRAEAGQILLYTSDDLLHWRFVSILLRGIPELGTIAECPDLLTIDGQDALVFSAIGVVGGGANVNLALGQMDWQTGQFSPRTIHPLDHGRDFYAPQSFEHLGTRYLISWLHSADATDYLPSHDQQWNGQMGSPRVLHLGKNGTLRQTPVLPAGYETDVVATDKSMPLAIATAVTACDGLAAGQSLMLAGKHGAIQLEQTAQTLMITTHDAIPTQHLALSLAPSTSFQIILDRSSLEVFTATGQVASLIYFVDTPLTEVRTSAGQVPLAIWHETANN